MKFIAYLMLIALLLGLFTACGTPVVQPDTQLEVPPSPAGEQEAVINAVPQEEIPPEEAPLEETPEEIPAAYREILDRYYLAVSEQWNAGQLNEEELNILCRYCYEGEALENIGYLVRDLDGDGTQELLIGTIGGDNFTYLLLFDLYTLSDGAAEPLFQGWERSRWYQLEDGRFYNYASASADYSFGDVYTLRDGELVISESLVEGEDEARFAAWADGRVQPDFTPLAQYA